MQCIFILFLPEKWEHYIDQLNCFYFTSWYTHILRTVSTLGLPVNKKEPKRKETMDFLLWVSYLSLSLFVIIFILGRWPVHGGYMGKNRYDGACWSSGFLRLPLFSFCAWSKFWFQLKTLSLRAVSVLTYSVVDATHLLRTHFESHRICIVGLPTGILYLQTLYGNGVARNSEHAYCVYLFCSCTCLIVSLDFTLKYSFKDKIIIKNFKIGTGEH